VRTIRRMRDKGRQRETNGGKRLAAVVLALALGVLAFGAASASAKKGNLTQATNTCWKDVINDWVQHSPNVVGTYDPVCYTQAIQHLSEYQDIQGYSNAPDDIQRAYLAALRNDRNGGPGSGGNFGAGGGGGGGGNTPSGPSSGSSGASYQSPDKGVLTKLFDAVGPGNADSIPLPLLVLAGLALLLLLAAAGTWLAKRFQARRMTPAPAPARRS
jgi:hypothetical protein